MRFSHTTMIGLVVIFSVLSSKNCDSKSSILNFLPAILSKRIEKKESFRLSPRGTEYTGSEELSFLSIDFPEFAVEQADVVEVASYKRYSKAIGDIDIVKAFSVRPAEQDIFRKPVSITVTLDSMSESAMAFYADDKGYLWPMAIKERNGQSIIFYTQHASDFLIIKPHDGWDSIPFFDTFFDPKVDGFQINNFKDRKNGTDGVCTGMSLFAIEYYNKYKKINGGLYGSFTESLHWYSNKIEQHLIASSMHYLTTKDNDIVKIPPPFDLVYVSNIKEIAAYIYTTKSPQFIAVCGNEGEEECHAVVAFRYNLLNNSLAIYDPNHHGVEYEWVFGTLPSCWQEFGWTSVKNIRILTGSYQGTIEAVAKKIYLEAKNSELMKIATSNIKVTTPGDGWIDYDYAGGSFYIRGSIDKDQIFPPERITFNIYNGREHVTCLAKYFDQWDFSYLYNDTPNKSVTVDVDPVTGLFEAAVDFTSLNRMEKLEAVSHVTVEGKEIQLKTNIWKSDGTAINFDTYTKQILKTDIKQCFDTWCPGFPFGMGTDSCFR